MKSSNNSSDSIISFLLISVLFLVLLPGLAAAAGTLVMYYAEGMKALPPVATRLAFAAAGMMAVSLITAKLLKTDLRFLKAPVILSLAGIVLVPLEAGLTNAFSTPDRAETSATALMLQTDEIAQTLLTVAPVVLLVTAVFMMGGHLADMTWQKLRSKKTTA